MLQDEEMAVKVRWNGTRRGDDCQEARVVPSSEDTAAQTRENGTR